VKFGVSLFNKRHPEFLAISAVAVQRLLSGRVVGDSSVNFNVLPLTVLEKLKDNETILETIFGNQVPEDFRVYANIKESTKEPTIVKDSLLDVSRNHSVLH
jgi:hypothetical protein